MAGRWQRVVLGATLVYTVLYTAWTFGHWWGDRVTVSDVASWPVLVVAIILSWQRARTAGERERMAWRLIAAAYSSWLVAEVLWFVEEVVRHRAPFPSVADAFYLAFY